MSTQSPEPGEFQHPGWALVRTNGMVPDGVYDLDTSSDGYYLNPPVRDGFQQVRDRQAYYEDERATQCRSASDGECSWTSCPQLSDNEPAATGRHCPLDLLPWGADIGSRGGSDV